MVDFPQSLPAPARTAYADADHERVYQVYAAIEPPSIRQAAILSGFSPRTVELWATKEGWVQRRAVESRDRVAAMRTAIDARLLAAGTEAIDRALELMRQDDDLPTAARMTVQVLGLLGYTPVTKSASVVQHLSGSDASAPAGSEARSVGEIAAALHARMDALTCATPSPPEEINETNERTMTGGVPQSRASDTSHLPHSGASPTSDSSSSSSSSPGSDEGADDVIDAEWSDGAVPEEE